MSGVVDGRRCCRLVLVSYEHPLGGRSGSTVSDVLLQVRRANLQHGQLECLGAKRRCPVLKEKERREKLKAWVEGLVRDEDRERVCHAVMKLHVRMIAKSTRRGEGKKLVSHIGHRQRCQMHSGGSLAGRWGCASMRPFACVGGGPGLGANPRTMVQMRWFLGMSIHGLMGPCLSHMDVVELSLP